MSDQSIIVRNESSGLYSFGTAAHAARDEALAASALIGKVNTSEDNEKAVAAQLALATVISGVEKARVERKEPYLEEGRKIDATAKDFVAECKSEKARVDGLVRDYLQVQQAKERAEEQVRNEELSRLEREKAQAIVDAAGKEGLTHEKLDAIHDHFNQKAAELPVKKFEKPAGQTAKPDWEIKVTDPWLLAKAHPECVSIEPRILEIKERLRAGLPVAGVTATPIVRVGVRLPTARKAISV